MDNAQRTATLSRGKGKGLIGSILPAFFLSLIIGAILLGLCALLLSRSADPGRWVRTIGMALPALCAFFGGFIGGKREKNMGALVGLLSGLLFVGFLLLLAAVTGGAVTSLGIRAVCYTLLLLLSTLGGVAGSMDVSKKRGRRRHRR